MVNSTLSRGLGERECNSVYNTPSLTISRFRVFFGPSDKKCLFMMFSGWYRHKCVSDRLETVFVDVEKIENLRQRFYAQVEQSYDLLY